MLRQPKDLGVRVVHHQAGDQFEFGRAGVTVLAPDAESLTISGDEICLR